MQKRFRLKPKPLLLLYIVVASFVKLKTNIIEFKVRSIIFSKFYQNIFYPQFEFAIYIFQY